MVNLGVDIKNTTIVNDLDSLYVYRKNMYNKFISLRAKFAKEVSESYPILMYGKDCKDVVYKSIIRKFKFNGFLPTTAVELKKFKFVKWDGTEFK